MNSSPDSTERTLWWRTTRGTAGIVPLTKSSTDGAVAPTAAIEQPSQLIPASQNACTTFSGPSGSVDCSGCGSRLRSRSAADSKRSTRLWSSFVSGASRTAALILINLSRLFAPMAGKDDQPGAIGVAVHQDAPQRDYFSSLRSASCQSFLTTSASRRNVTAITSALITTP